MPSETTSESAARLARIPAQVRHIHLIGVAGSAMAALAGMLAERGLRVTGSDNQLYEPTASLLKRLKIRSEEHTSELQSHLNIVCRLLLEKKKITQDTPHFVTFLTVSTP